MEMKNILVRHKTAQADFSFFISHFKVLPVS